MLRANLRGPAGISTRMIVLGMSTAVGFQASVAE